MTPIITPETSEQALTLALKLAIQAPTDKQALDVMHIAEQIAQSMSKDVVELCRMAAIAAVQYEDAYQ